MKHKAELGQLLERIYERYHKPEYINPDPLVFARKYTKLYDRETAALIASSLALGRVELIMKAVSGVLDKFESPYDEIKRLDYSDYSEMFKGFSYRFFKTSHLAGFLSGIGKIIGRYGSLGDCFNYFHREEGTLIPAVHRFSRELAALCPECPGILVTESWKGSAFKRFNLFLRWMVRCDAIDPGGWEFIDRRELIVPLDTHMMKIGRYLGLTGRTTPSLRTALEITENLGLYDIMDPVRYDFSLTRLGIHPDLTIETLKVLTEEILDEKH